MADTHYEAKDLWTARFEYLRVIVLYPEDPETVAYCYYRAGLCSEALALAAEDPAAAKDANHYWSTVTTRFKDTRWAQAAAKKLEGEWEP